MSGARSSSQCHNMDSQLLLLYRREGPRPGRISPSKRFGTFLIAAVTSSPIEIAQMLGLVPLVVLHISSPKLPLVILFCCREIRSTALQPRHMAQRMYCNMAGDGELERIEPGDRACKAWGRIL